MGVQPGEASTFEDPFPPESLLLLTPGADEFFPVLIYVVVKALPARLESNLAYIQRFRRAGRLAAESAYFLTNVMSVAAFLESVDASKLNIDPDEFLAR